MQVEMDDDRKMDFPEFLLLMAEKMGNQDKAFLLNTVDTPCHPKKPMSLHMIRQL